MKSIIIFACLFAFTVAACVQKTRISDEEYYNRLYYTCKVWGYVKYFHSEMESKEMNWDDILLETLDGIKNAPDRSSFNKVLLEMINKAGEMKSNPNKLPEVPDSLNLNDTNWFEDPVFSKSVRDKLKNINILFRPHFNRYVRRLSSPNPLFDRDTTYYSGSFYPDERKRTLALFRYWNIIQYFYPYKKIMDTDWDVTLKKFIPIIVGAENELSYQLAFKEFTASIDDSHSICYSSCEYYRNKSAFPPFSVREIENEMVIKRVLPGITGVSPGDVIKRIDGFDINYLKDSLRRYAHGSNAISVENNLNYFILYGREGPFSLTVSDGVDDKTIKLERDTSNVRKLVADNNPVWRQVYRKDGSRIGIVDMGRLEVSQVKKMFDDLWKTDAIIFDIRNYPRSTLWYIVNYLFKSPVYIANFTIPDPTYPGRLSWNKAVIGNGTKNPYTGSIIILFNERTQSQAEYTCMGLDQFPRSLKIGSTTAAADGNVSRIFLPGQITTMATFLGTYYPDYTGTQRVGIIPDIKITPTIRGIRNGKDEVLEAALKCQLPLSEK